MTRNRSEEIKRFLHFGWKVHTDINHKHYIENNLVCIANNDCLSQGDEMAKMALYKKL